jgi:hypothetical protein
MTRGVAMLSHRLALYETELRRFGSEIDTLAGERCLLALCARLSIVNLQ